MAARRSTHLSIGQCAEIADVCTAARQPELISAFIRDGICPEDVRQMLAKPTTCSAQFNAKPLNMQALEEAAAERFCFASLAGEAEITL
jgi:hypothetical protein